MSFGRKVLRKIRHSYDEGLLAKPQPLIWTPRQDADSDRTFCGKCAVHYPRPTCFYDQYRGEAATGPRCDECDHVVRCEAIVEEGKTWMRVLVRCHGAEELHHHELGTEYWRDNADEPGDHYEEFRRIRLSVRYFVPSEQGELTTVGGA